METHPQAVVRWISFTSKLEIKELGSPFYPIVKISASLKINKFKSRLLGNSFFSKPGWSSCFILSLEERTIQYKL